MSEPSAKVIADSVSPGGVRLTTLEVVMHRFVLAEFNTHRQFSRNSASSRAIPVQKQLDRVCEDPALPFYWGAEQKGMQSGELLDGNDLHRARALFDDVRISTISLIDAYLARTSVEKVRLHKSLLNRLIEPFMWHKVIVTATEWDNFFALRCHPAAQPEMRMAAEAMRLAYDNSSPMEVGYGEWHVPYTPSVPPKFRLPLELRLKMSVAACAWVSTSNPEGERSPEAVAAMYQRLTTAVPMHASPLEHQATPGQGPGNFTGWRQLRHLIEAGEEPWNPSREGRTGDTQPLPVASNAPVAHKMVQEDLEERLQVGISRYGQPLQPFNGRDSLRDAYEEILDLAVYLRTELYEREQLAELKAQYARIEDET